MAIDKQTIAEILRLYCAEKWKVGTIARQLGIHHNTARRVVIEAGMPRHPGPRRPSKIDPFLPFIRQTLKTWPGLPASRLYQMAVARGYRGSQSHFRARIAPERPRPVAEAYLRLSALPGELAQVDWAHFGTVTVGRAKRPLMAFVMVLSHSRRLFLHFYLNGGMHNFLRGHIEAFEAWQGVPREIWYDNLKSVVLERHGDAIRFNPLFLDFAAHYHILPRPVAIAKTRCHRPGQREGTRGTGHTLRPRQLLRRPRLALRRRSQQPGQAVVRHRRRRPALAGRPFHLCG